MSINYCPNCGHGLEGHNLIDNAPKDIDYKIEYGTPILDSELEAAHDRLFKAEEHVALGPDISELSEYNDAPPKYFYVKDQQVLWLDVAMVVTEVNNYTSGHQRITLQEFEMDGSIRQDTKHILWNHADELGNELTEKEPI